MAEILVMDDEQSVLDLLTVALEKNGHKVTSLTDGALIFEALEKQKYALVVLDIMMPGLDGFNAVLKLKDNEKFKNIPVIMISALKPARDLFENIPSVKGFFAKPFDMDLLLDKVEESLKNS